MGKLSFPNKYILWSLHAVVTLCAIVVLPEHGYKNVTMIAIKIACFIWSK